MNENKMGIMPVNKLFAYNGGTNGFIYVDRCII